MPKETKEMYETKLDGVYGSVISEIHGTIFLQERAELEGTSQPYFTAHGLDEEGNDYRVRWETTAEYDEMRRKDLAGEECDVIELEDAANWSNPSKIVAL